MNPSNNLEGSWDAYNKRKISNGQNPEFFAPEDVWELNYLLDMILDSRPHLDHLTVMLSVREGIRKTMAPRPRQHFIDIVMTNLKSRENQWLQLVKSMGNDRTDVSNSEDYPFSFN
ncbi:MAG TPA: hypothetical protein VM101_11190 [Flavitalea sp.]|nr:hypothetical protein [Flavitalea sp.]